MLTTVNVGTVAAKRTVRRAIVQLIDQDGVHAGQRQSMIVPLPMQPGSTVGDILPTVQMRALRLFGIEVDCLAEKKNGGTCLHADTLLIRLAPVNEEDLVLLGLHKEALSNFKKRCAEQLLEESARLKKRPKGVVVPPPPRRTVQLSYEEQLFKAADGGKRAAWLQKLESYHIFTDDAGGEHKYALHLAEECRSFSELCQPTDPSKGKFPVFVFFHGKGSSSFFEYVTKKVRNTGAPGLDFCASNFVVLSPKCDWDWKAIPSRWVDEFILAFANLPGVDESRIYVSGHSMGGMSCWEVLARMPPTTFAAAAPAAAYHRTEDARQRLAEGVAKVLDEGTAVKAFHGDRDSRCSLAGERALWQMLKEGDSLGCFSETVLAGEDHDSSFTSLYWDTTYFYEWLLEHSRSQA